MKGMSLMVCLFAAVTPLTHAAAVHADKLPPPKSMTCLQLKQGISYTITRGLLHIPWNIELASGAYISEHEDAHGVYYRAPSGAITERRTDKQATSRAGRRMTFDGGIYVPNDATAAPTLYTYDETLTSAPEAIPTPTECGTLSYAVDPSTHKVSVWGTAAAAGIGAAAGMVASRSFHPQMRGSYGQAAGVGLVGGLIGGLIIGAIEKSKADEILAGPPMDSEAAEKIRAWAASKITMTERGHSAASSMTTAAPAASEALPATTANTADTGAPMNAEPTASGAAIAQTAALPAATGASEAPMTSRAQGAANQLGCSTVKAVSAGGYVASCGSYGVFIDCDTDRCRPTHTVRLEGGE